MVIILVFEFNESWNLLDDIILFENLSLLRYINYWWNFKFCVLCLDWIICEILIELKYGLLNNILLG